MIKPNKRDVIRAATVKDTAEVTGVSPRFVNMVMNGERDNEVVVSVFMELQEGRNLLLQSVKKLVPFS